MKPVSLPALVALATLTLVAGCADDFATTIPTSGVVNVPASDCPSDAPCTVVAEHNYVSDPDIVRETVEAVVYAGCQRFFGGDCTDICQQVTYCPESMEACLSDNTALFLKGYALPAVDTHHAAQCRTDVLATPCLAIFPPPTTACTIGLTEGCAGDSDNLGAPYNWLSAARVEGSVNEFTVQLCPGVSEWLVVKLNEGEKLRFHSPDVEPSESLIDISHGRVKDGDDRIRQFKVKQLSWGDSEPTEFPAEEFTGDVYLSLEAEASLTFRLRIEILSP